MPNMYSYYAHANIHTEIAYHRIILRFHASPRTRLRGRLQLRPPIHSRNVNRHNIHTHTSPLYMDAWGFILESYLGDGRLFSDRPKHIHFILCKVNTNKERRLADNIFSKNLKRENIPTSMHIIHTIPYILCYIECFCAQLTFKQTKYTYYGSSLCLLLKC